MSRSGNQPTIREIQAVLSILAESLGGDCKERMDPLDDIPANKKPATVEPRAIKYSDCERQLYGIVERLQQILSMAQTG